MRSLQQCCGRAALGAFLIVSASACDGVVDEDRLVEDQEVDEADDEADGPPAEVIADAEVDEDDAPVEDAGGDSLDLAVDEGSEAAICLLPYTQKKVRNLDTFTYGKIAEVELQTACTYAYARVNVTNVGAASSSTEIALELQYWNGALWISVAPKTDWGFGRSSSSSSTIEFAPNTYVRACGRIYSLYFNEGSSFLCTDYYLVS